MKAASFDYIKPKTIKAALLQFEKYGGEAVFMSGGQSLLPALNMRLQAPVMVIDLSEIAALAGIKKRKNSLFIGAFTTHNALLNHELVQKHLPLITKAVPYIAHQAIRNRGTIGGSLAHADPATELPACCLALEAVIHVEGLAGKRAINAKDFFLGLYQTALEDEIIVAVEFPLHEGKAAFQELVRRHGDYAIVGLAAFKMAHKTNYAYFGVGDKPELLHNEAEIARLEPFADLNGSSDYKKHLAYVLFKRMNAELNA